MNSRRDFMVKLAAIAATPLAVSGQVLGAEAAPAPAGEKLKETDPMAVALGYKEDSTKVDAVKYPQHKPEQVCSGCALYQGKPGDVEAPCTAVGNKIVVGPGWCAVYAPKPPAP